MEKLIIHMLTITKKKEKHSFQILLPENARAITGIAVTVDQYLIWKPGFFKMEREAGLLQLFASDTGEHIFSDNPHATFRPIEYQWFGDELAFGQLWTWKEKFELLSTWQPVTSRVIDAYYKDTAGKIMDEVNYNVRIYIRLKLSSDAAVLRS
jgi:hypothetical protein